MQTLKECLKSGLKSKDLTKPKLKSGVKRGIGNDTLKNPTGIEKK
jgi:hypothetical protein